MSQPQAQQPQNTGPFAGIEQSFNAHKGAWTIGLAVLGLLVTLVLWKSSSSSGSVSTNKDSGSTVANGTAGADTQQADYNSIMLALEGLTSSLPQSIANAINGAGGGGGKPPLTGGPVPVDIPVGIHNGTPGPNAPSGGTFTLPPLASAYSPVLSSYLTPSVRNDDTRGMTHAVGVN